MLLWSFGRATLHSFVHYSNFIPCALGIMTILQKCCKALLMLRFSESGRTAIGGMLMLCRKEKKA